VTYIDAAGDRRAPRTSLIPSSPQRLWHPGPNVCDPLMPQAATWIRACMCGRTTESRNKYSKDRLELSTELLKAGSHNTFLGRHRSSHHQILHILSVSVHKRSLDSLRLDLITVTRVDGGSVSHPKLPHMRHARVSLGCGRRTCAPFPSCLRHCGLHLFKHHSQIEMGTTLF
jgi:hypothetical protein